MLNNIKIGLKKSVFCLFIWILIKEICTFAAISLWKML